jgi:PKD repeat protein
MQLGISPSVERGQSPFTARFAISAERVSHPVTYRVTFGDEAPGTPETITTSPKLEHTYTNTGFYVVKVVATDAELRTGSTFATVHAYAPEDARDFTASSLGYGGDPFSYGHEIQVKFDYTEASKRTVKFRAANTPKPATGLSFNWDFGDGTFSTDAQPSHTYSRDGVYEVRMTASDGLQRWRQRIWLPVSQQKPAVAIQRPPLIEGGSPLKLTLDALVTRGEEPLSFDWSFGDVKRSDPSPRFSFTKQGESELRLTVKDRHGIKYEAPPVVVRVRPGPIDYRMPLAVVSPQTGSTRAVVVDHSGAHPVPLSSPLIDGAARLVDISANGIYMGVVTADGLLVRRIRDGLPVLSFLPAAGEIRLVRVTAIDDNVVAFVTLENSVEVSSWMVCSGADPIRIGSGFLAAVASDGTSVVLSAKLDGSPQACKHFNVDPDSGRISTPLDFGQAIEVALSRDGSVAYYIGAENRLVRRNTRSGDQQYIGSDKDIKRGLACSEDGRAVVFSVPLDNGHNIIYGRQTSDGDFRLASVTDRTGWGSQYLRLSGDGRYLFSYGSRDVLAGLLARNGTADSPDTSGRSPVDGEEGPSAVETATVTGSGPPRVRERFGIVRLFLGDAPNDWDIKSTNPRFVYECNANFSVAGPFD